MSLTGDFSPPTSAPTWPSTPPDQLLGCSPHEQVLGCSPHLSRCWGAPSHEQVLQCSPHLSSSWDDPPRREQLLGCSPASCCLLCLAQGFVPQHLQAQGSVRRRVSLLPAALGAASADSARPQLGACHGHQNRGAAGATAPRPCALQGPPSAGVWGCTRPCRPLCPSGTMHGVRGLAATAGPTVCRSSPSQRLPLHRKGN